MESLMGRKGGGNFQRRSKCLFLRTSKLGHLCASSSALRRAYGECYTCQFHSILEVNVFPEKFSILIFFGLGLGLIILSNGNLLSGFSVLVNVCLNDKYRQQGVHQRQSLQSLLWLKRKKSLLIEM